MKRTGRQAFKDFVIAEASPRALRGRSAGEFLVCRPTRGPGGKIVLNLNLPASIKRQMLDAMAKGSAIRIFSPQ